MPVMLAPATKSSPLFVGIAATLAFAASLSATGPAALGRRLRSGLLSLPGLAVGAMLGWMAFSISWAHAPNGSLAQFAQFGGVVLCAVALALCLPAAAPRRRAALMALGLAGAAALMAADLKTGLWLRSLTGGRETTYTYNRGLVTLALLLWPTLALVFAARKPWLALPLLALAPLAVFSGESAAAIVALLVGVLVFPVAALIPQTTRWLGLAATLAGLAVQPWFGTLMRNLLTGGFHETFKGAHSSDRVDIWLSFEAAARAKWLFGNGFGSSVNLQNAAVAAQVPPDRVTMLGASHPHNAFLQVWVELGLLGAALAAVLITLLFHGVGRLRPALQPFALACLAAAAMVALVSHGAWQAWWWAALAACLAGFAVLDRELGRGAPPL